MKRVRNFSALQQQTNWTKKGDCFKLSKSKFPLYPDGISTDVCVLIGEKVLLNFSQKKKLINMKILLLS